MMITFKEWNALGLPDKQQHLNYISGCYSDYNFVPSTISGRVWIYATRRKSKSLAAEVAFLGCFDTHEQATHVATILELGNP